jgi:hypothetical protein
VARPFSLGAAGACLTSIASRVAIAIAMTDYQLMADAPVAKPRRVKKPRTH